MAMAANINFKAAGWKLRRAFGKKGSAVICVVSWMHIIQAGLYLENQVAGNATCMRAIVFVFETFGISLGLLVPLFLITAILAMVGALANLGWGRLMIFMPQHFFLGVMAIGGIFASMAGHYLDGTVVQWQHILTDQLPMVALFVVHSSSIIRRAREL